MRYPKKITRNITLILSARILASPGYASAYLLPNIDKDSEIQHYIQQIYIYGVGMIGIIATVVIMIGGLIWISSLGNAGRVNTAKDWIGSAILGLALAMFSYMILFIINPDLVEFQPLRIDKVPADPSGSAASDPTTKTASVMGWCTRGSEEGVTTRCAQTTEISCSDSGGKWTTTEPKHCRDKKQQVSGTPYDAKSNCPHYLYASGKCKDCVNCMTLSGVRINDGNKLEANLGTKIQTVLTEQNFAGQRLSEAWPPKVAHASACHQNGTCADISMDSRDPTQVQAMYNELVDAGLNPMYEPPKLDCEPQPRCNCNRYAGVNCNPNTKSTGAHFHVTNNPDR